MGVDEILGFTSNFEIWVDRGSLMTGRQTHFRESEE